MPLVSRLLFSALLFLILSGSTPGWSQSGEEILIGKVLAIGDGDTFYLRTQDGRELWIALWGVECPDVGEKVGMKARRYAEKAVLGREIGFQMVIAREETERSYGRVVYRGSEDLARDLLRMGMAVWIRSVAPDATDYEEAQKAAQTERLGVWEQLRPPDESDSSSVTP